MDKVNLCIDIGNTNTKAALYKNGVEIKHHWKLSVEKLREYIKEFEPTILVSKSGSNEDVEAMLEKEQYLTHETPLPITLDYKTPETLGPDRIATAVGAFSMDADSNWVIIDLGTCLTLDLLQNGVYQGGLISPGIAMRFRAMDEFTAALPLANYDKEVQFPGKSTQESLQVGVGRGIVNEINGFVGQLNTRLGSLKIVDCSSIPIDFDKEVKNEIFARPKLVLEGLNSIIEHNNK